MNLVFEPEIHDWYGEHVQLICKDVQKAENFFLTRDFLVKIFVLLREILKEDTILSVGEVQTVLQEKTGKEVETGTINIALAVFEELTILYRFSKNGTDYYRRRIIPNRKLDLLSSSVYRKYKQ